jgi:hypothetical protein
MSMMVMVSKLVDTGHAGWRVGEMTMVSGRPLRGVLCRAQAGQKACWLASQGDERGD